MLALATLAGALIRLRLPWSAGLCVGVVLASIGWARRRPMPLALACFVLATTLAARAWDGAAPDPPGPFAGVVTLREDPRPLGAGIVADGVTGGRHLELRAFGSSARRLRSRLAGQQVMVEGRISRPSARQAGWLRSRHIVGVLEVQRVATVGEGNALARSANRVRTQLERGARTMTALERSLYLGFVVGDDRAHPEAVRDDFRAAGLAHLSAVSGQNVGFVLAVVAPALRRLGHRARWAATLAVIAWFAALTRFEPSVLRASVMAALAATAVVAGRPADSVRILGLTVTIVLLADPLLVRSVGWWLSVGATAGIALLATPLARRLPGPGPLRAATSMTIAAQLGVAPISVAVFGPLPLASVPANLLAVPAAAPVMVYGLPAGLVAAMVPDGVAAVVQAPTVVLVRYIAGVAHAAAGWPLPQLGVPALAAATVAVAVVLSRPPRHPR